MDNIGASTVSSWFASCPLRRFRGRWLFLLCGPWSAFPAGAASAPTNAFVDLSLEELSNVRITSVSRTEERLGDSAAAVYVITGEAIRRSGAHSLPEALRLAPNLLVARVNAYQYAISARGFNSTTANKLLVMIDGRTVYTPLYSGVFWDAQDVLLQDVERIEVVSGSGGTLWGTNAVNGVINVITQRARADDGDLVELSGSSERTVLAASHAAGSIDHPYRLYAKTARWRASERSDGSAAPDRGGHDQAGFRLDQKHGAGELSVLGDVYQGREEQTTPGRVHLTGANVMTRWEASADGGAHTHVQAYVDRTTRDIPGTLNEQLSTYDLEAHYSGARREGGQTIVGAGYRYSNDRVANTGLLAFLPPNRRLHWGNLFAQHERDLASAWRLTAGLRLETNDYTGLETLPNLKLAWRWRPEQVAWLGLARAVRAPSRIDREFYYPGKSPFVYAGGPGFRSEVVRNVDLGWRGQAGQVFSYTMVLYHSRYEHVRSVDPLGGGVQVLGNQIHGQANGMDGWASVQMSRSWTVELHALALREHYDGPNLNAARPGNDPRLQYSVNSRWSGDDGRTLDLSARHVGRLPAPAVPAYTVLDLRWGWQLGRQFDLTLGATNLFNRRHQEFPASSTQVSPNPVEFGRALDLTLIAKF